MNSIISRIQSVLTINKFSKKKKLEKIRSIWGKQLERIPNLDLISGYHNLISSGKEEDYIDDKTWSDLNFNSIYSLLDRNITGPGRQYLYHILHKYEKNRDILNERFDLAEYFRNNADLREKIQLQLLRLSNDDTYFIINLISGGKPKIPKYPVLIYLSSFVTLLMLFLTLYWSPFLFAALFMCLINVIVDKIYSSEIYDTFLGFFNLNKLIITANSLAGIKESDGVRQLSLLQKQHSLLKSLSKKIGYLVIDKSSLDPLIQSLIEYLNLFCLFDLVAYTRSVKKLYKYRSELLEVFNAIASLDCAITTASYMESIPTYSKPTFSYDNSITFEEVYHPLIENAVPNTVTNLKKSTIFTGSNMAGKTTFIKCIGVNFILAQTLNLCLARKAVIPELIVKASIKIEDNIEDSKSYYFTEVDELQKFIGLCSNQKKYLFIIDEIFRGTNTIERLGASTSVLKYLNHNNMVLVTTHDIELQELLNNEFEMYHFNEQIDEGVYYFDYKLKKGIWTSGNAIKLLELKGYPEIITKEAYSIAESLSKSNGNTVNIE